MEAEERIEPALTEAIESIEQHSGPPRLAAAVRHALFPGGARMRPRLCLAVAHACSEDDPVTTDRAAAAIELLHCASLIHDDLPCFDDASVRRGKASVHEAFGEPLAVLAGDALIVLAFKILSRNVARAPQRTGALLQTVAHAAGAPKGLVAGQAWECEPEVPGEIYRQAKTGSLFAAATVAGAAAAGVEHEPWRQLGERVGNAYQVIDDIQDMAGDAEEMGKPVGQDAATGRPSSAHELGVDGARARYDELVGDLATVIPPCPDREWLAMLLREEAQRLLREKMSQSAA